MCTETTANDGGLGNVLQASERVSECLLTLCQHNEFQGGDATARTGGKRKLSRSLSEISGRTERSLRMGLAQHTSAQLNQAVAPLIKELENLDASALLSLKPSKDGRGAILDPCRGLTVPPIHESVYPQYNDEGPNIVRYLHVIEVPHKYSIGIFVFPPHSGIPLHDHPDMVVLSRILYGELNVQSYNVLPDKGSDDDKSDSNGTKPCSDETLAASPVTPSSALRRSLEKIKDFVSHTMLPYNEEEGMQVDSVLHVTPNRNPLGMDSNVDKSSPLSFSAPNVTCLYPHDGNCHAFVAGPNGAAVFDVLLPPYDGDDDRDCTFYDPSSANSHSGLITLTPIDQPDDFHCIGGQYGHFGDRAEEYSSDEDQTVPAEDESM